jgi:hypothetical protein
MRLDDFMAKLSGDLEKWTVEQGGKFHVARDPLHPYVILAGGAYATFVVILSYVGGKKQGGDEHPHAMRSAAVEVFIGHPVDLRSDPTAWLFKNDGQSESMLKQLNDLAARLLTIVFSNGERNDAAYAEYEGEEQATLPNGTPLKAYKLTASWPLTIEVNPSDYRFLN